MRVDDLPAPQRPATTRRVLAQPVDFTDADISDHLDFLFRGTHGYVCLAMLDRSDPTPKPVEKWFRWPDQRDDAVSWIKQVKNKRWVEVYYCPNPMRTKDRAAGNSLARFIVHADVDTVLAASVSRRLRALGFRFVASGTPGRVQVLARLSRSLTLAEHRAVERALQRLTRADAKISDNDYLRMPDTWNNKHHPRVDASKRNDRRYACEVTWPGKGKVSTDKLINELGATVTDDVEETKKVEGWKRVRRPRIKDRVLALIDVEPETGRRSEQCYAAVAACVEQGWDRDQIHTVLDTFAPGLDKWGSDRWHDELDRILVKRDLDADGAVLAYDVEKEFWARRPVLKHIYDAALASVASPWATLGVVMTRVLYCIPSNVEIPKLAGGRRGGGSGSLNLFVALIGNSGGGKMTATTAGVDAVETGRAIRGMSIGSGEGISKAFKGNAGEDALQRTAIWFDVAEVTTWNAIASRQGATLSAEVCRAWSGEALGFQNADKEKTNHVLAGTYRMTMIIGAQPGQCGPLLGSLDMGLPQRFLYLPTWFDGDLPEGDDREAPDAYMWEPPSFDTDGYTIRIPGGVRALMLQRRREQIRSDFKGDPLESHALLIRLRVAVALALLDDRADVDEDDWDLAGVVMHVSSKTRALVMETLDRKRRIENVRRGQEEAQRKMASDRYTARAEHEEVAKVADLIMRLLERHGSLSEGDVRRRIAHRRRGMIPGAIEHLTSTRKIVSQQGVLALRKSRV